MCQIICWNIQALKWRTNFQNISSRFVTTIIYNEFSKLTGTPNIWKHRLYGNISNAFMMLRKWLLSIILEPSKDNSQSFSTTDYTCWLDEANVC